MLTEEKQIYIGLLLTAIILAVILFFFLLSFIKQFRLNRRLQHEKMLAEIVALENERKRMAADLHDEIGAVISGIKFLISSAKYGTPAAQRNIETAVKHIDALLSRIREISYNLDPVILHRKGLLIALTELFEDLNNTGKIKILFNYQIDEPALRHDKLIHLYRIIREIINNSMKHAGASYINIALKEVKNKYEIHISDDGIGFDVRTVHKNLQGTGLRNILSRVEILKATLQIESEPGAGVKYILKIPSFFYEEKPHH